MKRAEEGMKEGTKWRSEGRMKDLILVDFTFVDEMIVLKFHSRYIYIKHFSGLNSRNMDTDELFI